MSISTGVFNMFNSPILLIVEISGDTDIVVYFLDVADEHSWQTFSDDDLLLLSVNGEVGEIGTDRTYPVVVVRPLGYDLTPLDDFLCMSVVQAYLKSLK